MEKIEQNWKVQVIKDNPLILLLSLIIGIHQRRKEYLERIRFLFFTILEKILKS
jgi:hypothetical protein